MIVGMHIIKDKPKKKGIFFKIFTTLYHFFQDLINL